MKEITIKSYETKVQAIIADLYDMKGLKQSIKKQNIRTQDFADYIKENKELSRQYALCQEFRADLMVDELLDIADSNDDPAKVRNQINARQWCAAKLKPKTYGDRIDLNVTQTLEIGQTLALAKSRLTKQSDSDDYIDSYKSET